MRLVLLGAPGSGKGTQADFLKMKYGCVHISTGDILRQNLKNGTELGLKVKTFMDNGELVPDDLVVLMVQKRLQEEDTAAGFLMDGFPRTVPQAEAFEKMLEVLRRPLDGALFMKAHEEALVQRLVNRRTCRSCGKIWNLLNAPGKKCSDCEGELYQRDDDKEPVIRNRIKIYHDQTEPLISWYEKKGLLRVAEASGTPEDIFKEVQVLLGR